MQASPHRPKSHMNKYTRHNTTSVSYPSVHQYDDQNSDEHFEKYYQPTHIMQQPAMDLFINNTQSLDVSQTPQKHSTAASAKNKSNKKLGSSFHQSTTNQRNGNNTPMSIDRNRSKSARSTRLKTETNLSQIGTPTLKTKYSIHHEDKLKVFVKFKPPNQGLINKNVHYTSEKQVQIERQTNNKIYTFDYVFHHQTKSSDVFATACKDLIDQAVYQGKNGLIFVYGHTGTGKTYTMGLLDFVHEGSTGIVPESIRYIFEQPLQNITLSFTQIYMDEVYDMLNFEGQKKMTIREHQKTKEPYVENLINISINSVEEAYQLINIGLEKRKIAEQRVNKRSSRGHGIITLNIMCKNKVSKISFVDLAGSERIKESDSTGLKLNEAVHINSSLSALETLLMNIHDKSVRIYRGNKLTRLLQPFIECGKIRLFVTSNYENIQPIQFAKRCKGIKFLEREVPEPQIHKPRNKKQVLNTKQMNELKQKIERLESQNKNLLYCLTNLTGIFVKISNNLTELLESQNIQSNFSLSQGLSIRNETLEHKLNSKIKEMEQKQSEIIAKGCQNSFKGIIQDVMGLLRDPGVFMKKVHEIGMGIFTSSKQLGVLSEYKNIYKKSIFISELKINVLESKNQQFQNAINYLLKNQPSHLQNKLSKQLKEMGILIQRNAVNGSKKIVRNPKQEIKEKNISDIRRDKDKATKDPKTPLKKSRANTQNSPLNREHTPVTRAVKRGEIWIQEM